MFSLTISGLIPLVSIQSTKVDQLCARANGIVEEAAFFSHHTDDTSSNASSGFGSDDLYEISDDLKTDIECLVKLEPIFNNPLLDPEPEATAQASPVSWMPHQLFIDKIENWFPQADVQLLSRLGKANYERWLRCQAERDGQGEENAE